MWGIMLFADQLTLFVTTILSMLIMVAFLTLFERKILSYSQNRKGPNKMGMLGLFQPFGDALKLLSKTESKLNNTNWLVYSFFPIMMFMLSISLWLLSPLFYWFIDMKYSLIFFLVITSLTVYGLIFSGWSSNSKYSLLGSLRAVAQTISYEICLAFIIISLAIVYNSYSLTSFYLMSNMYFNSLCFLPLYYLWSVSCLVEVNRAPFDLAEGESELVSGFNTEYSSLKFTLIFLSEYNNMIIMSLLTMLLFFPNTSEHFFILKIMLFLLFFMWMRSSYPRFRYDYLMTLVWKIYLSITLMILVTVQFF